MSNLEKTLSALNEMFSSGNDRVKTEELYNKISNEFDPKMELHDFRIQMRKWIDESALEDFILVKGRFGGIRKANDRPKAAVTKTNTNIVEHAEEEESYDLDDEEDRNFSLMLNPSTRVYPTDKRNWALQKKAENDLWISQAYYPDLEGVLRCVVRKSLNNELKLSTDKIETIKSLADKLSQMEKRINEELANIVTQRLAQ